ncbi:MAG: Fe2+-dependent dioxygenase [Gammaproteobacteria bacterium]|nr:Fe2+-dependent dioxygenase [Gammaproteobacteria bacterium]
MLCVIEGLLSAEEAGQVRHRLRGGQWQDGRTTAGALAQQVKSNQQLAPADPLAQQLGEQILARLGQHALFTSAALPEKIYPPRFNRYANGGRYGTHVDGAMMVLPGSGELLRSDLSATLFLSPADEYEGGELIIETEFGAQQVKLNAGDLVLYPSSSLHQVAAVTRGERVAAFFWVQSMVRDAAQRSLLFDLDQSIQALTGKLGVDDAEVLRLNGVYHNLLRGWGL